VAIIDARFDDFIPFPGRIVQIRIVEVAVRSPGLVQQPSDRTWESGMCPKNMCLWAEKLTNHKIVESATYEPHARRVIGQRALDIARY
jgi:hypothetical protein